MAAWVNNKQKNARQGGARLICAALLMSLCTGLCFSAESNIYRYVDKNGRTVYNSIVPPEYIRNGYTVLNDKGQVIEEVARSLTQAELDARSDARVAQEKAEEQARKQLEADNLLMRLYRTPEEIIRKRDDRIRQIEAQITALTATINKNKAEIDRITGLIENAKTNGVEPAVDTLKNIESKHNELARLEEQEASLQQSKEAVRSDADKDVKRLRELLDLPEEAATE